ncbi:MAG: site-specific integrase [Ruminococcus sp.]|nr:site-specific integrase [Ruminococcus sp.]
MANIEKRGNSYRIKVSCGYDAKGKQVTQRMTWAPEPGMTKRQIEKELQRQTVLFEEACLQGNMVATIKFEDFAKQWFKEYAEMRLKESTLQGYHSMESRIYKAIGHIRLDKLTTRQIQKFILDLCEATCEGRRNRDKKLSTKTIKLYRSMISSILDYAVKMQMIRENPCKNVQIPRVTTPEKEYYTIEEAQKLFELFEDESEHNYIYVCFHILAIYSGFRLGELMGLEWKDINFDTNVVTVNRTCLYSKDKGHYTETPKTALSMRSLKLPQDVMDVLNKWQGLQDKQRKKVGSKWIETDRVFTKWNGETLDRSAPGRYFKKFCERTGMRYVSNHSWRHLNATLLINSGIDVKTVQSCLGHSVATTTLNLYCHTFQTAKAAAMEAVAEALPLSYSKNGKITATKCKDDSKSEKDAS